MSPAWISLFSLLFIILISRQERVNGGILAVILAWTIGFLWAGMGLLELLHTFPLALFKILFGVTFFFGLAKTNGTLDKISHLMLRCARGNIVFLPLIFFILALVLAMIGPGNIGAVALLAPLMMAIAGKTGISAFFTTVMLVNGANAGTFSPFSPTGIIADELITRLGLTMNPWTEVFLPSLFAQTFIACTFYFILITQMRRKKVVFDFNVDKIVKPVEPFNHNQNMTVLATGILILGVIVFQMDIGYLAIGLTILLIMGKKSDGMAAISTVPWNVIIMVCGVSTLINVMEKTGGLDLFTSFLAKISTPANVTGVLAFVTGVMSSYSSSSGVVMPAFIPVVPQLIEKIGGGDPEALIAAINVGSHVVDVSPLSILGALCIANAGKHENKRKLFHQLLVYGLSMSVFGAIVCYMFFG